MRKIIIQWILPSIAFGVMWSQLFPYVMAAYMEECDNQQQSWIASIACVVIFSGLLLLAIWMMTRMKDEKMSVMQAASFIVIYAAGFFTDFFEEILWHMCWIITHVYAGGNNWEGFDKVIYTVIWLAAVACNLLAAFLFLCGILNVVYIIFKK